LFWSAQPHIQSGWAVYVTSTCSICAYFKTT
jgi:hypothetical protein